MTERLERDVADVARKWVPDPRLGVLEVSVEPQRVAGCTTSREALAALRRIAADAGRAADIRLLPDASVRDEPAAVVTAAVAPLLREPRIAADRVSEALHGEPLALLERREEGGVWLRVRAGTGFPMSPFGQGRVGSCTPRWRAAASDRTTCSARRPARGGCVTCWWPCGA